MNTGKPDKTVRVSGTLEVLADDNNMLIEANGGLVMVTVMDTRDIVMYMYHPLSGWYIESDQRGDVVDHAQHGQ